MRPVSDATTSTGTSIATASATGTGNGTAGGGGCQGRRSPRVRACERRGDSCWVDAHGGALWMSRGGGREGRRGRFLLG